MWSSPTSFTIPWTALGFIFGPYLLLPLLSLKLRSSLSQRLLKAWSSLTIRKHLPSRGERRYYSPRTFPLKVQESWEQVSSSVTAETQQGHPRATAVRMMKVWRWSSKDLGFGHIPQFGEHQTVFSFAQIRDISWFVSGTIFPGFYSVPR